MGEQGVGDQVLYASLIRELQASCHHVVAEVDKRLVPLFRRSFSGNIHIESIGRLTSAGEGRFADSYIALAELGRIYRQSESSFPQDQCSYLVADASRCRQLVESIRGKSNKRIIGLSWQSAGKGYENRCKSINMAEMATALSRIDAHFLCLQYGVSRHDIDLLNNSLGIHIRFIEDIDLWNDIDGLASLVEACDTVITTSNITAHLAGALGKRTHLLVPQAPNYYWGLNKSKTPWYQSLDIYRQSVNGDWKEPLEILATVLASEDN